MGLKKYISVLLCLFLMCCLTDRRSQYIKTHPDLNIRIREAIQSGDVLIDMTKEQVIASRGYPIHINKTTTANVIYEQWVYVTSSQSALLNPKAYQYAYIYFENGRVTSWQSY